MLIEGADWEKTRREWGAAGVKRINAAMPAAARKAAQSPDCDRVEIVGLSDRSKPKKDIVFYVDCANEQRFYISEADAKSEALVASKNAQTAELPHRARCIIDDQGIHPAEISTN